MGRRIGVWENPVTKTLEDVSILPKDQNKRPSPEDRDKEGITMHHVRGDNIYFVVYIQHVHTSEGTTEELVGADSLARLLIPNDALHHLRIL